MTPTSIPSAGPHGARNGGGVSYQGPAVNKFGNSAGSSDNQNFIESPLGGLVTDAPQTPGADGANRENAGGIL